MNDSPSEEIKLVLEKQVNEHQQEVSLLKLQVSKLNADLSAATLRVESKELQNTQLQGDFCMNIC